MTTNQDGNRRIENGRLVYYSQKTDAHFWDQQWLSGLNAAYYAASTQGQLNYFEKTFTRHLSKTDRILEAGCGTGQWVIALQARGYHCHGLDYAIESLRRANQIIPAPYIGGDITQLGLASSAYDAIISLGVVEHRKAGPEPFLQEMTRILRPGGKLLISVPFYNPLRQWRAAHGAYHDHVEGLDFYQQAFTRQEFCALIQQHGYTILEWLSYDHRKTLRQEINLLAKTGPLTSRIIQKISDYLPWVNTQLGHMLMVVAEKQ
jgi:SAM-dependent methyltransferase